MIGYILHRFLIMIPTLVIISALVFFIIELPPGDYLETYVNTILTAGETDAAAVLWEPGAVL